MINSHHVLVITSGACFPSRWIPYKYFNNILDKTAVDELSPELHPDKALNASMPITTDVMPLQYSQMFSTTASQILHLEELSFMRNKHVVILGSSLDREAVIQFCRSHAGASRLIGYPHGYHYCTFPSFNFTISLWHHFGVHQSTWFHGGDKLSAGTTIEDRIEKAFLRMTVKLGKPDMLIFTSGLWGA